MFLDDELKQIYLHSLEVNEASRETMAKLLNACLNRLVKPEEVNQHKWLNEYPTLLKQVDNSYRRFFNECKPYYFDPDTFREYVYRLSASNMSAEDVEKFFSSINWPIKPEWRS